MAATKWNDGFTWQQNPESGDGQWLDPSRGGAVSAYDPSFTPRGFINPQTLAALQKMGWQGDPYSNTPGDYAASQDSPGNAAGASQLSPEFQAWMEQNGVKPSSYANGDGSNVDFTGPDGLIGSSHHSAMQSPEFMAAAALGGGMFLGPGLLAGAGGGADGMALAEGAYPSSITGAAGGATGAVGAGGAVAGSGASGGGLGSLLGTSGGVLGTGLSAGNVGSLIGAAGGLLGNGSGLNSATQTTQNTVDPRLAKYLYGPDGNGGLLGSVGQLYQQQMQTGGLNPLQQQGIASQQSVLQDPRYMQGFNQMRGVGSGLLNQPIAGNPFANGRSLAPSSPQSLMDMGRSYIPQRPGLLGSQ